MLALLLAAAQIANPGFEQGLRGWQSEGHRGIVAGVESNEGYTIRRAARGEHYLVMGWRARNAAPPEASRRVFSRFDARRYRGRTIRVSAQTKAPDFAHRNAGLIVSAAGAEGRVAIAASENWRRHEVTFRVPRAARWIEIAFVVEGTASELAVDDVRLNVLRWR